MKKNLSIDHKKSLIKISIISLVVGGIIIYLLMSYLHKGDTFADGVNFSKQRLAQNYPRFNVSDTEEIKKVTGVVTSIEGGDTLIVKINPLEPLAPSDLDIRNVKVGPLTNIYVAVFKGGTEYQKELVAYQKSILAGKIITRPEPYKNIEGSINDISNNKVDITSDKDIKNEKSFIATEIIVHKTQ